MNTEKRELQWTCEPISDEGLCGSCKYWEQQTDYPEYTMFGTCEVKEVTTQMDDGCETWIR